MIEDVERLRLMASRYPGGLKNPNGAALTRVLDRLATLEAAVARADDLADAVRRFIPVPVHPGNRIDLGAYSTAQLIEATAAYRSARASSPESEDES